MTAAASTERILSDLTVESGSIEVKNRMVMLVEKQRGRMIHGIVSITPEDATLQTLETGMSHQSVYYLQSPADPETGISRGPTYVIPSESVVHLELIDAMPAEQVTWLTPDQLAQY